MALPHGQGAGLRAMLPEKQVCPNFKRDLHTRRAIRKRLFKEQTNGNCERHSFLFLRAEGAVPMPLADRSGSLGAAPRARRWPCRQGRGQRPDGAAGSAPG